MSDYVLKTDGDVTISLNEYRYLYNERAKREHLEKTVEMILDYLKDRSTTNLTNEEVIFFSNEDLDELAVILKYRCPDEFAEMEELVKFRKAQEKAALEDEDEDYDA